MPPGDGPMRALLAFVVVLLSAACGAPLALSSGPTAAASPTAATSPTAADAAWVVLYVRNNSPVEVWDAVFDDGGVRDPGTDYSSGTSGAGCYLMPIGSRLVLLDRSARDPGASVLREVYSRSGKRVDPPLWILISKEGAIVQGVGVPFWWGKPYSC